LIAEVANDESDDNEDSSFTNSPSKAEGASQPAPTPPVISFNIIESLVYNAVETNRLDLFQYARKEIILNERDAYKNITKKNANELKEMMREGGGVHLANMGEQLLKNMKLPSSPKSVSEEQMRQYETLYSESMMQLQEANFLMHPNQYRFVFPFEVILHINVIFVV
jgi:hypothetical protein